MAPIEFTMDTVKKHNKPTDLWVVIDNKVYNLTKFREDHPGGEEPLDVVAGTEATNDFHSIGHSAEAREMMKKYYIGNLASSEEAK